MCFRVREFVAKLLQPHCAHNIQSNSHYHCVATVILGFAVFASNVIGCRHPQQASSGWGRSFCPSDS